MQQTKTIVIEDSIRGADRRLASRSCHHFGLTPSARATGRYVEPRGPKDTGDNESGVLAPDPGADNATRHVEAAVQSHDTHRRSSRWRLMARRTMTTAALQPDLFSQDGGFADIPARPILSAVAPTQRMGPSCATVVPPSVLDEDDMARHLELTGRYRVLRQLQPRPIHPLVGTVADGLRIGMILDTETTGLDYAMQEVIELGMVAFTFDDSGIRDVVGVFSALRESMHPITPEITRITGITDDMVRGQRIDLDEVARFIEPADLVIAHNARFDRPFCEKLAPGFDVKPWACSVSEVDWTALGYEGTKLGYLLGQCGWFHNGHRAVDDCYALLEVLAGASRKEGVAAPFTQLLRSAGRTRLHIHAIGSPFHTKDTLKARGYRWCDGTNGRPKCWWREIDEDTYDEEASFLANEVYGRDVEAHVERLTACERFKK